MLLLGEASELPEEPEGISVRISLKNSWSTFSTASMARGARRAPGVRGDASNWTSGSMRLMSPLIAGKIGKANQGFVANLKRVLERSSP